LEDLVLTIRRELKELSDLGEFGAEAIYRELVVRGVKKPPVVRTIGRILERRGALEPLAVFLNAAALSMGASVCDACHHLVAGICRKLPKDE
jgi:hypothetical protein